MTDINSAQQLAENSLIAFSQVPATTFEDQLARWELTVKMQRVWAQQEKELRLALFGGAVPNPKEGTNNVTLADGRICKFTHKMNRKVDGESAIVALQSLGVNDVEQYIKVKYELAVGPYKKAEGQVRAALDTHVTTTPGLPTLEVK